VLKGFFKLYEPLKAIKALLIIYILKEREFPSAMHSRTEKCVKQYQALDMGGS
jgi:hypothetical protein